jgi:hypothetical protein
LVDPSGKKTCSGCKKDYSRREHLERHFKDIHGMRIGNHRSSIRGIANWFTVFPTNHAVDVDLFLKNTKPIVVDQLTKMMGRGGITFWSALEVNFEKLDGNTSTGHFNHRKKYVRYSGHLDGLLEAGGEEILKNLESYEQQGSGWTVASIGHLDVSFLYNHWGTATVAV